MEGEEEEEEEEEAEEGNVESGNDGNGGEGLCCVRVRKGWEGHCTVRVDRCAAGDEYSKSITTIISHHYRIDQK